MRKSLLAVVGLLVVLSLLAACAPAATEEPAGFKVGQVTDVGGIDDKSFNQTAWLGMQNAEADLGVEVAYLESQQQTDYAVSLQEFIDQGYDMVVTVGYLLTEDTATFAAKYPDVYFAGIDQFYETPLPNLMGLTFATDQAAFQAGYLAAGMTKTGKVSTFGGIEIPPVTIFMVAFEAGVGYYNEQNGTDVEVLGTDVFVGNFESTDDGRRVGEDLIAEGADIVMPVAGPVGLGTAAAIQDNPGTMLIGVDTDWCVSAAEYCDVTLTSVQKRMDMTVPQAIGQALDGTFEGGVLLGTLANDGVSLASFNEFEDEIPDDLKSALDDVAAGITDGTIDTGWPVE
jgi:basic membrane protein A